jgi:alpha-beta hydrolase superfamily lysophospholipase
MSRISINAAARSRPNSNVQLSSAMPSESLLITETVRGVLAEDGYQLHYRVWNGSRYPRAMIVLVNGVMSHSGWFRSLARSLAARNLLVVGADRRGSGLNHGARGDAASAEVLVKDLSKIIEQERLEDCALYLAGWCWGAVLAINAAEEFRSFVHGLILLAPGLYPSAAIKRAMQEQEKHLKDNVFNAPCLVSPIREDMFTHGPYLDDFIRRDEFRLLTFTPRFYRIMLRMGLTAITQLADLEHPVLLILATKDAAVDNDQTRRAFERVKKTSVTVATCDCQHGMQFEATEHLVEHITYWLDSKGTHVTAKTSA